MRGSLNWGGGIAIVYLLFAGATIGFVSFAMGRRVELVSPDYYDQALHQDDRMQAERNARALGAALSVTQVEPAVVVLSLPRDQRGRLHGTLTLYRPSNERADREAPITLDANGRQEISLAGLARGRWLLRARWSVEGRGYYLEHPVLVP